VIASTYIVTGLLLTAQTYWMLAWAIWGAPTNTWEYLALLGSLTLLIAGILHIWRRRAATYLAAISEVLIWCFYAPTLFFTFRSILSPTSGAALTGELLLRILFEYSFLAISTCLTARHLITLRPARVN
jgi:hypothetical protein